LKFDIKAFTTGPLTPIAETEKVQTQPAALIAPLSETERPDAAAAK
jgi:hypothetical protein